jgi:hypothetical protein
MQPVMSPKATSALGRRAPLPVDPSRSIAVKRDVHEFILDADAATVARAFREVVTDPRSSFGLIRVKRPADRLGQPFTVGERFQGCFSVELALGKAAGLLRVPGLRALAGLIEDTMLSDYAEVVDIVEDTAAQRFMLEYRYLEGTPIAGRSIFTIEPCGNGCSRVRQIFEYQEVNGIALGTFQRFGLKYHDQVVQMEIERAAALAGARVLEGTIPAEYRAM